MTFQIITVLNGASALAVVCCAFVLSAASAYYYIKKKSQPMATCAFLCAAIGMGWIGISLTTLSVLIYGYNLPGLRAIIPYFSYSTVPIGALGIMYTSWDVAGSPANKKVVLLSFGAFSVFYYIVLYATFNAAVVIPEVPKGEIYDDWITPLSLFYYILWGEVSFAAIVTLVGFNKFRKASPGELKKKAKFVIVAATLLGPGILLDTVIFMEAEAFLLFIPRLMVLVSAILIFAAFKPTK